MHDPWKARQRIVRGSSWFPLDMDHTLQVRSAVRAETPEVSTGFRTTLNHRQPKEVTVP